MNVKRWALPTRDQQWMHLRNFSKFRLEGMKVNLNKIKASGILTAPEEANINAALKEITTLTRFWKSGNRISKMSF